VKGKIQLKKFLRSNEGFNSITNDQFEEYPEIQQNLSIESNGTAGPLSRENSRENGAFFQVVLPKGIGPFHALRLIITFLFDGRIKDEIFVVIIYDLLERVLRHAERDRNFRKKWRKHIKALVLLCRILPLVNKNLGSISKVKYLIQNRMSQEINFIKFLLPFSIRNDEVLEGIKVVRHRKYTPPAKKSTKIPSNSQGTKGSYQPDSISWKDVANKEYIFENGKFVKVFETPHKNPGDLIK